MEQPAAVAAPELIWCQYAGDGVTVVPTTIPPPVQIEIGSTDIARQINQQMQVQYSLNSQGQMVLHPMPLLQQQQMQQTQSQPTIVSTVQPAVVTSSSSVQTTAAVSGVPVVQHQHGEITVAQVLQEMNALPSKPVKSRNCGGRVTCSECTKTFSCFANLRDHMRLHTGEKPFKCTECDMEFAQRSNWRLHKRVHTGEKPYMCGICGKTFARSSHLPGHMRIHTGEKPFKCEQCPRYFPSSQALKNHTRTHTGEKPFKCSYCETAFTHSSSLSSHRKKCNGIKRKRGRPTGTGRKPLKKKQPSGRPRGRPKKKVRSGRGRKKLTPTSFESVESPQQRQTLELKSVSIKKEMEGFENNGTESDTEDNHIFTLTDVRSLKEVPTTSWDIENNMEESLPKSSTQVSVSSKQPKVAVRESVRLRIKQENRRAKNEYLNISKTESDIQEPKYVMQQSIVIDGESEDIGEEHESVILEHNEISGGITGMECSSTSGAESSVIHINVSAGNESCSPSDLQQEAALTMATLPLQGVLNLTQSIRQNSIHDQVVQNSAHPHEMVTFVSPTNLHQHASITNQVSGSTHSNSNSEGISLSNPTQLMTSAPQYITYHLNGNEVHVPVSLGRNVKLTDLSTNWT